ncbi:methyltransferase domain-containing protein [Butyrivibrio sp. VCB2006]|uniref:methyltransferase domain-containing protein n=1 Tax=Butyrivibrio sp. VCB2006 TaxID=1280679 RepID=UPI0018CB98E6|nr:methyltransferase domain-containing protein [Butyrivibrio sp. VCB2006]
MNKNNSYVIWGCGYSGKGIANILTDLGYHVACFIDIDEDKNGKLYNDIPTVTPDCFAELECGECTIIIGVESLKDETDILAFIQQINNRGQECIKNLLRYTEIKNCLCMECTDFYREKRIYRWEIDFDESLRNWVGNIDSEIDYWKGVCYNHGPAHDEYVSRIKNESFSGMYKNTVDIEDRLSKGDIVVDLGCGLTSMYGKLAKNGEIKLISMDPLAAYYNKLNKVFSAKENVSIDKCRYGLFEFLDCFLPDNYADCIIINNALDHCIDPFRAICKCLKVLKVGAVLHMRHRQSEAVYEGWIGLHRWNIDYENDDLVIWNKENAINVSDEIRSFAKTVVTSPADDINAGNKYITVDIIKTCDIEENIKEYSKEKAELALLSELLLEKDAELRLNGSM